MTRRLVTTGAGLLALGAASVAVALGLGAGSGGGFPEGVWSNAEISFNRDVRPILSDKCFACHGPDAAAREADLRLDVREEALAPRGIGPAAVVPGEPDESGLVQRIFSDDPDEVMPPPRAKHPLTAEEREVLRRWVEGGAPYEAHWSFVPLPGAFPVPEGDDAGWCRDPLDRFVLRRLKSEGVAPSREAERWRWLRRVSLDLTGLPPTPEEIAAFLADDEPGAHGRVVDRLLASPAFGERMATPWLDAARYADSYGFQSDLLSPTWPWRDWVVGAFNENMPYDEFLTAQIAGDLLPDATRDDRLATAFNRLHRMTNEGGSIPAEWRAEFAADRVETLGTAVLGLTLACARCHDHKYDPVSQREYYQLTAYFNSIDEHGLYERSDIVPTPTLLLPTPEQEQRLAELRGAVDEREAELAALPGAATADFILWWETHAPDVVLADVVGRFSFDAIADEGTLENLVGDEAPPGRSGVGASTEPPQVVGGRFGNAVRLDGDNVVHLPGVGDLDRWTPFTVAFWLRDTSPEPGERVVLHRSGGTDAGHYGFDLLIEEGWLVSRAFRHWPGNAIAVRTEEAVVPEGEWTHIVWQYDGSSEADGFGLFVNGRRVGTEVLRDRVWKTIGGGTPYGPGGHDLVLGQRFRDRGLAGGEFDELVLVRRAVTDVEAGWLFAHGRAVAGAIPHEPDPLRVLVYYRSAIDPAVREAAERLGEARAALARFENEIPEIMVMEELPQPRETHVLARGEYDAATDASTRVVRGVPGAISGESVRPADRLGLAAWLTSPDHPLTARVAVNRLWQLCFGRGLVETSEDFGVQGSAPTHPDLLDFLAREFVDSGWDTKALLRRIVLSATYRQDSVASPALREVDPANRLLARGPSRRLSAEMLRDTALSASGLLVETRGGPPASPYQPDGLWRAFNGFSPAYQQGTGDDLYRRSLYTVWKRTAPMPSMTMFDAPGREVCVAQRAETNTPLQALVLLNDPQFVEANRVLAGSVLAEESGRDERIDAVFLRLAGRRPGAEEREAVSELLVEQLAVFTDQPSKAVALLAVGEAPTLEGLDPAEHAAWTVLVQAVMNSDASVWQR